MAMAILSLAEKEMFAHKIFRIKSIWKKVNRYEWLLPGGKIAGSDGPDGEADSG